MRGFGGSRVRAGFMADGQKEEVLARLRLSPRHNLLLLDQVAGSESEFRIDGRMSHVVITRRERQIIGVASLRIESIIGFASASHRIESHHTYYLKTLTHTKRERERKSKGVKTQTRAIMA